MIRYYYSGTSAAGPAVIGMESGPEQLRRLETEINQLMSHIQSLQMEKMQLNTDLDQQHRENIQLIEERERLKGDIHLINLNLNTYKKALQRVESDQSRLIELLRVIGDKYPDVQTKIDEILKIGGILL